MNTKGQRFAFCVFLLALPLSAAAQAPIDAKAFSPTLEDVPYPYPSNS